MLEIHLEPGRPVVAGPRLGSLGERLELLVEPAAKAVHDDRVLLHQPREERDVFVGKEAQHLVEPRLHFLRRKVRPRLVVAHFGDAVRHVQQDHDPRAFLAVFPLLAGRQEEHARQERIDENPDVGEERGHEPIECVAIALHGRQNDSRQSGDRNQEEQRHHPRNREQQ